MGLALEEQETQINFMRGDERAEVYTTDATVMTKLNKLIETAGTEWKLKEEVRIKGKVVGRVYTCPVSFISFRSKRVRRELTEKQRREIASRLRK